MWKTLKQVCQALKDRQLGPKQSHPKRHYQTFTYFIPGPKQDVSGYREKQLDKALHKFLSQGWDIIDFKTQAYSGKQSQGMWVIFLVSSTREDLKEVDLESFGPEALDSTKEGFSKNSPISQSKGPVSDTASEGQEVIYEVEPDDDSLKSNLPELERKK